jgi:hypothetical protein
VKAIYPTTINAKREVKTVTGLLRENFGRRLSFIRTMNCSVVKGETGKVKSPMSKVRCETRNEGSEMKNPSLV